MKTRFYLLMCWLTLILAILVGCEKPDKSKLAYVETTAVSDIAETTATSGGNIISDGGAAITARGVCWSTRPNPTTALSTKTSDGTGIGIFTSRITGLTANTFYYVQAYATNSAGTAYWEERTFLTKIKGRFNPSLTYGTVSDIDDNVYKTIQIGDQVWMAENLKTTKYNDGTSIPNVTDDKDWFHRTLPGYCWYENNVDNKDVYGALYNWFTVNTGKLCPEGWHVPTDAEWHTLVLFLDPNAVQEALEESQIAGDKLKETGTTHWPIINLRATNESGFTALPGGMRMGSQDTQTFWDICYIGEWWSSTEYNTGSAWLRMISNYPEVGRFYGWKWNGHSVRCVKD